MIEIKPWRQIEVPEPRADELYELTLFDRRFTFRGLKALLGAADFSKAGDELCGLAAENEVAREAARSILSSLTLKHLYDRPLTDDEGRVDSVMRINYDIDRERVSRACRHDARRSQEFADAREAEGRQADRRGADRRHGRGADQADGRARADLRRQETEAIGQGAHGRRRCRHAVVAPAAEPSDRRSRCDHAADLHRACRWARAMRSSASIRRSTRSRTSRRRSITSTSFAARPARRRRSACSLTSRRSSPASKAGRPLRSCSKVSPAPTAR